MIGQGRWAVGGPLGGRRRVQAPTSSVSENIQLGDNILIDRTRILLVVDVAFRVHGKGTIIAEGRNFYSPETTMFTQSSRFVLDKNVTFCLPRPRNINSTFRCAVWK